MIHFNSGWYKTIRMKVILAVTLTSTAVLGSFGTISIIQEQRAVQHNLENTASVTAQRLANTLSGSIWDVDKNAANSIVESEMIDKNISAIVVWWTQDVKVIFSGSARDEKGNLVALKHEIKGDFIKSSRNVNNHNRVIGEIDVYVSKGLLNKQLKLSIYKNLIVLSLLILTMIVVMMIVMNRVVIQPITRLSEYADSIGRGKLNQNIIAESNDEIGQLTSAFRRMHVRLLTTIKHFKNSANAM